MYISREEVSHGSVFPTLVDGRVSDPSGSARVPNNTERQVLPADSSAEAGHDLSQPDPQAKPSQAIPVPNASAMIAMLDVVHVYVVVDGVGRIRCQLEENSRSPERETRHLRRLSCNHPSGVETTAIGISLDDGQTGSKLLFLGSLIPAQIILHAVLRTTYACELAGPNGAKKKAVVKGDIKLIMTRSSPRTPWPRSPWSPGRGCRRGPGGSTTSAFGAPCALFPW